MAWVRHGFSLERLRFRSRFPGATLTEKPAPSAERHASSGGGMSLRSDLGFVLQTKRLLNSLMYSNRLLRQFHFWASPAPCSWTTKTLFTSWSMVRIIDVSTSNARTRSGNVTSWNNCFILLRMRCGRRIGSTGCKTFISAGTGAGVLG